MRLRTAIFLILSLPLWLGLSNALHAQEGGDSMLPEDTAETQAAGEVQQLTGAIREGDIYYYLIPDLQRGQTLTVLAEGQTGNLDPVLGLLNAADDVDAVEAAYAAALQSALSGDGDPVIALNESRDEIFLAWNDDSGDGLAAALE